MPTRTTLKFMDPAASAPGSYCEVYLVQEVDRMLAELQSEWGQFKTEVQGVLDQLSDEFNDFKADVQSAIQTLEQEFNDYKEDFDAYKDELEQQVNDAIDFFQDYIDTELQAVQEQVEHLVEDERLRATAEELRIEKRLDEEVLLMLGKPDGFASLDNNGKVPVSQIAVEFMSYEGVWNANTNTPRLPLNGADIDKGMCWIVDTAGIFADIEFAMGDYIMWSGSAWQKLGSSSSISSGVDDLVECTVEDIEELFANKEIHPLYDMVFTYDAASETLRIESDSEELCVDRNGILTLPPLPGAAELEANGTLKLKDMHR